MHCPSCGQQQVSQETKFCSRCGMPLGTVAEVLAHGGYLPQLAELGKKKTFFSRRNGLAFTLIWFLFFLFIMAPFWGIMNVEELAALSAILAIFGGLIMLISTFLFLKKDAPVMHVDPTFLGPSSQRNMHGQPDFSALPPHQSIPASAYGPPRAGSWRDTNDLQPSVTEGTTKLLEKDER
jgi:hypothetical protein